MNYIILYPIAYTTIYYSMSEKGGWTTPSSFVFGSSPQLYHADELPFGKV